MTRAAHPQPLVQRAFELRRKGLSYGRIARQLEREFSRHVGDATVRDWVTYRSRGQGA